mgnify:CR=1 FL=1
MLEQVIISIQIILIDIVMAADNAIIIGLIAAGFATDNRRKIIAWGVAAAFLFRIIFASGANYLFEFAWKVDILKATEYMLPQTRVRVFLRGIRKLISNTVPPCLPPFGHRDIRECLGDFPYTPRSAYTGPQQRNLKQFEQVICRRVREGTLEMDDVVFVSVDRSQDRIYEQIITFF